MRCTIAGDIGGMESLIHELCMQLVFQKVYVGF